MTLEQELIDFAQSTGNTDKLLLTLISGNIPNLGSLDTVEKGNLVAALNELHGEINALSASAGAISDGTTGTGTTWSSTKIADAIQVAVNALIGGAASAYDTLIELQNEIQANDTDMSGLLTAVGNRVRFDAAQTLTEIEKAQARTNIDAISATAIGNPERDLVAVYTAALA